MPERDLALLTEAARDAGRIALRYWRKNPQVWDKGGEHGPVTEADLAVNDMLKARLLAARPGYGWLSEETPDDAARLACETVFIIDPIDGTGKTEVLGAGPTGDHLDRLQPANRTRNA